MEHCVCAALQHRRCHTGSQLLLCRPGDARAAVQCGHDSVECARSCVESGCLRSTRLTHPCRPSHPYPVAPPPAFSFTITRLSDFRVPWLLPCPGLRGPCSAQPCSGRMPTAGLLGLMVLLSVVGEDECCSSNDIEQQQTCAVQRRALPPARSWHMSRRSWRRRLEELLPSTCDKLTSSFDALGLVLSSRLHSWPAASTRGILGTLAGWHFVAREVSYRDSSGSCSIGYDTSLEPSTAWCGVVYVES